MLQIRSSYWDRLFSKLLHRCTSGFLFHFSHSLSSTRPALLSYNNSIFYPCFFPTTTHSKAMKVCWQKVQALGSKNRHCASYVFCCWHERTLKYKVSAIPQWEKKCLQPLNILLSGNTAQQQRNNLKQQRFVAFGNCLRVLSRNGEKLWLHSIFFTKVLLELSHPIIDAKCDSNWFNSSQWLDLGHLC